MGEEMVVHEMRDDYPAPSLDSRAELVSRLESLPAGATVIIDGLISGCVPEILSREAGRLRLISLLHHPLADETGVSEGEAVELLRTEKEALSHVSAVIVTSDFTKQRLNELFDHDSKNVFVVQPGTDPRPISSGGDGKVISLVCVASLTRRKGHPILFAALSELRELPWRLVCVGGSALDPEHANHLREVLMNIGLTDRVVLKSDLASDALSACYDQADVFVLPSLYEGFGMVITEALSHGLPIVTTTGGALRYTAPDSATLFAHPGDKASLKEALGRVLSDSGLRGRLAEGAQKARTLLPTWEDAGALFLSTLRDIEASKAPKHG